MVVAFADGATMMFLSGAVSGAGAGVATSIAIVLQITLSSFTRLRRGKVLSGSLLGELENRYETYRYLYNTGCASRKSNKNCTRVSIILVCLPSKSERRIGSSRNESL